MTDDSPAPQEAEDTKFKGFGKGYLRWIILALLAEKPRSGYDLQQAIDEHLGGWKPSPGTIYPILHHLSEHKLITGHPDEKEGRQRIIYELNEEGRSKLDQAAAHHIMFMSALRRILGKHGAPLMPPRPALDVDHILPKMRERVKHLYDEVELLPKEIAQDPVKAVERLSSRLKFLEEQASWLEEAITRIKKQLRQLEEQGST
ncbi:MAG: PadR family transcriptional regulator [Promethearchaeota archaeon]